MSANGYLAPSELASIGNGLFLRNDAAKSFLAMDAVASSEGVQINWPGTAGAYRPWAMQLDMRVHPALYGINPYMQALPGLPSSHGTGLARDVPFGAPNNWMIANAGTFGWTRPARTLKLNDLNHWEFTPGTATASLDLTPIIEQKEDDTMLRFITRDSASPWFVTDGLTKRYVAPGEDQLLVDLGLAVRETDGKPKLLGAKLDMIPDAVRAVGLDAAAIAAAIAPLLPDTVDDAALVAAIAPAIAKAVNDDAAKRLAQ